MCGRHGDSSSAGWHLITVHFSEEAELRCLSPPFSPGAQHM